MHTHLPSSTSVPYTLLGPVVYGECAERSSSMRILRMLAENPLSVCASSV